MNVELVCGADQYRCDLFTSGPIPAIARFTAGAAYYLCTLCWDVHRGSGDFRIEVVYGKETPFYTLPSTPLAKLASEARSGYFDDASGVITSGWFTDMKLDEAGTWDDILIIIRPLTARPCGVSFVAGFLGT